MKTIIAGSRTITDYPTLKQAMSEAQAEFGTVTTTVVCGMAEGVDMLGYRWATEMHVAVDRFPADWRKHGRAAGPIRNREMAKHADALVALHDGTSRGTKNMIEEAQKRGLKVFVKIIK